MNFPNVKSWMLTCSCYQSGPRRRTQVDHSDGWSEVCVQRRKAAQNSGPALEYGWPNRQSRLSVWSFCSNPSSRCVPQRPADVDQERAEYYSLQPPMCCCAWCEFTPTARISPPGSLYSLVQAFSLWGSTWSHTQWGEPLSVTHWNGSWKSNSGSPWVNNKGNCALLPSLFFPSVFILCHFKVSKSHGNHPRITCAF